MSQLSGSVGIPVGQGSEDLVYGWFPLVGNGDGSALFGLLASMSTAQTQWRKVNRVRNLNILRRLRGDLHHPTNEPG